MAYSEKEVMGSDIEFVPPPERPHQVSGMVRLMGWGLLVFAAASDLLTGGYEPNSLGLPILRLLVMAIFAAVFSELCAMMAGSIKKNMDFAWAVGFLFGFIGFGVYWGYYRITLARNAKQGKAKNSKPQTKKRIIRR